MPSRRTERQVRPSSDRKSATATETTATRYSFRYIRKSRSRAGAAKLLICWRRGSGSNRRIKVLQTSPLPLGYRASKGPFTLSTLQIVGEVYRRQGMFWSGRPGSNRRHLPWQGSTLPLSYSRSHRFKYNGRFIYGQTSRRPKKGSETITFAELS